jgi:hypothetical protein
MPIQSSGQISLLDIQTEFGGTNPIGMDEYYLNGIYVTGTGAVGIPTSGKISLLDFYGKSKVVSVVVPAPVATSFSGTYAQSFGGTGSSSYEAITGAAGSNLTRTGVSTFNNIGAQGHGRGRDAVYMNLILQARPNDTISLTVNVSISGSWPETQRYYVNFGTGYNEVASSSFNGGSQSQTRNYTIPGNIPPGNYAIMFLNDYTSSPGSYRTVNYYSLHIF